jgi:hypothetical protein
MKHSLDTQSMKKNETDNTTFKTSSGASILIDDEHFSFVVKTLGEQTKDGKLLDYVTGASTLIADEYENLDQEKVAKLRHVVSKLSLQGYWSRFMPAAIFLDLLSRTSQRANSYHLPKSRPRS